MRHFHRLACTFTLVSSVVGAVGCAPPDEGASGTLFTDGPTQTTLAEGPTSRLRHGEPQIDVFTRDALRLNLFDDVVVDADVTRVRRTAHGRIWEGTAVGERGDVRLAVVADPRAGDVIVGTVRARGRLFQIAHTDGGHVISEVDDSRVLEHPPVTPRLGHLRASQMPGLGEPAPERGAPGAVGDRTSTEVDVMVVYTDQAQTAAGGAAAMAALVDLAVAETNESYAESGVGMHLRLVHQAPVTYDEVDFDYAATLTALQGSSDGNMDEVHALRNQYGADHVVLIVDTVTQYAGIGYQLQEPFAPFFADYAFSVVARTYATGAYTFAHELGHNMGANHDHDNSDQGYFPYSHGLQVPTSGYRTVMAYPCQGCVRVNRWSNPLVSYGGAPTGVADYADNARSLDGTKHISAAFRAPVIAPPTDIAEMSSPADQSTLSSRAVTFVWNDPGALSYRLDAGPTPGTDSYHDGASGSHTTAYVTGLPDDGSAVWVRLWSETHTAGWHYVDYSYTAWTAPPPPPQPAVIVAPAPGGTLTGSDATFAWQLVAGADKYRLRVGSQPDEDAFHDAETTGSSMLVTGLPTDGSVVMATLSTHGAQGWEDSHAFYYAHTAPAGPTGPAILSPVGGSVLAGITETFTWQDVGAFQYWVLIVRADDSYAFSGSVGDATSFTFYGLPTDGSNVEVTVFAELDSGWTKSEASFTAANDL